MKTQNIIRSIWLGSILALSTAALSPALYAQSQDNSSQSVAEAARKAKEQKKAATKDAKVITDDTIRLRPASADSGAPPAGTVVTSAPAGEARPQNDSAAPAADSSAAMAPAQPAPVADPKKKEEQNAEVAKAKELLAQVQAELDVLKRELALDSDTYFSNPDYSRDTAGKAKLDDLQKMIGDKQVSVEELKRQLADLMQKAGIAPDADKTAAPPKN
jgi:hypothetical protein